MSKGYIEEVLCDEEKLSVFKSILTNYYMKSFDMSYKDSHASAEGFIGEMNYACPIPVDAPKRTPLILTTDCE